MKKIQTSKQAGSKIAASITHHKGSPVQPQSNPPVVSPAPTLPAGVPTGSTQITPASTYFLLNQFTGLEDWYAQFNITQAGSYYFVLVYNDDSTELYGVDSLPSGDTETVSVNEQMIPGGTIVVYLAP